MSFGRNLANKRLREKALPDEYVERLREAANDAEAFAEADSQIDAGEFGGGSEAAEQAQAFRDAAMAVDEEEALEILEAAPQGGSVMREMLEMLSDGIEYSRGAKSARRAKRLQTKNAFEDALDRLIGQLRSDLSPEADPPLEEENREPVEQALELLENIEGMDAITVHEQEDIEEVLTALEEAGYESANLRAAFDDTVRESELDGASARGAVRTKSSDPDSLYRLAEKAIDDASRSMEAGDYGVAADQLRYGADQLDELNDLENKSSGAMRTKASRKGGSPFTRQERSESGIGEALDHVSQCAEAASHFWTAGDPDEAMSALDDLIAEAKAAKQKISSHGENYPAEPVEELEAASARAARIATRTSKLETKTTDFVGATNAAIASIANAEGDLQEAVSWLQGIDEEGIDASERIESIEEIRENLRSLADAMHSDLD